MLRSLLAGLSLLALTVALTSARASWWMEAEIRAMKYTRAMTGTANAANP